MATKLRASLLSAVALVLLQPAHARSRAAPPAVLAPEDLPVERHVLPNGLVVLTHEDHSVPTITFWQWYRVGSRNERPGITGISHFFEHMMFNGSAHVPPKEYDRILEGNGGSSNAFTDRDMTAYYEDVASDRLDVVLELDADRMASLSLLPEQLESEIGVVKEERRATTDDDIEGMLDESLFAAAFVASTYRWPVVGWMGDLERISRADMVSYFRTYYAPNNCILVLVGDFDTKAALAAITERFGPIPAQEPPPEPPNSEPPQRGERRVAVHYPAEAVSFQVGYKAVDARSSDAAPLELVAAMLADGPSSRLYRALVREQGRALSVGCYFSPRLEPDLFDIVVELAPGETFDAGISALDGELARFASEGPTAVELAKAVNGLEATFVRDLQTNNGVGQALGFHELVFGDHRAIFEVLARRRRVTVDDCRRVARTYFVPEQRTIAYLVSDTPDGGETTDAGVGP